MNAQEILDRQRAQVAERQRRYYERNRDAELARRAARAAAMRALCDKYRDEYRALCAAEAEHGEESKSRVYRRAQAWLREAHRAEYDELLDERKNR